MDILAVIPHEIASQGYMRSQVVKPLSYLSSLGLNVMLLCVLEESERSESFIAELASSGIKGYYIRPSKKSFMNYINCAVKAARIVKEKGPKILYAREVWGGLNCIYAKRGASHTGFVYDFRGAVPEEIAYCEPGIKGRVKERLFTFLERIMAKNAIRVSAVSNELSRHLYVKYGRKAEAVIPCCAASIPALDFVEIHKLRSALGFTPSDKVYIYCGSLNKWQMFSETVSLFSKISAADPEARLLVLTPDKQRAEPLLAGLRPGSFILRSAPQAEVARYLAVGDFGFLLREDNTVNNVAFPIKFAEYIISGLPVITTNGVSEIAGIIKDEGLGFTTDLVGGDIASLLEWSEKVMGNRELYRTRAREYGRKRLQWDSYRGEFERLYSFNP